MTSLRHNDTPEAAADPEGPAHSAGTAPAGTGATARDGYLDAARACILDVGWRRTTLTEVARRAGVSRMTIYRAWPDMPTLLGDLMTREWGTLVAEHADLVAHPANGSAPLPGTTPGTDTVTPELVADAVATTVAALRDNELFTRIVELDPELILPYLLARRGRSQELVLGALTAALATGQQNGAVRAGDPVTLARGVVLAAHGFVLSAQTMVDDAVALEALDAELRTLITRSLAP